jgi:hypothetical protein
MCDVPKLSKISASFGDLFVHFGFTQAASGSQTDAYRDLSFNTYFSVLFEATLQIEQCIHMKSCASVFALLIHEMSNVQQSQNDLG